ncbi:MAG: protein kinase, partial [Planctomycetes bacterium]|nr:protein kinase [Planctomycetota bacterium]
MDWARIKELYLTLLDVPADERSRRLHDLEGSDRELLPELRRLFRAHAEAELRLPSRFVADETTGRDRPTRSDDVPDTIGRYAVLEEAGRGGMGVVYRARDEWLGRDIAIKVLASPLSAEALERFRREARILASLTHPLVATLHTLEESEGRPFLTMEWVDGETLWHWIRAHRPEPARVLDVAVQLARALAEAHAKGIVHRDLKPANAMILRDGSVKILDFGLSLTRDGSGANESRFAGTIGYASPEQLRGDGLTPAADVWAWGCVVFECLLGHRLFDGDSLDAMARATLEQPIDLSVLPAKTPNRLREAIATALRRAKHRRPADGRQLVELLTRAESSPLVPRSALSAPRTRFVGREALLRELVEALEAHRWVTVLGPGGVGKTRVAIEALERFPRPSDRAVDVAPVRSIEELEARVLDALGLAPAADGCGDSFHQRVAERTDRILLDNCEHLPEVSAWLERLVERTGLRIVTTSRRSLRGSGERTLTVPPLPGGPEGEAVALFMTRAREEGVPISDDDPDDLRWATRICERLDGIPLAIELAASRLRHRSLADLGQRIEEEVRLLTSNEDSGEMRHRTLRDLIAWSFELLSESDQRVFVRLSVFPGTWTRDAALAVGEDSTVDLVLERLIDHSLVQVCRDSGERDTRYRLLTVVRAFASDQLSTETDRRTTRTRFVAWCRRWAGDRAERRSEEPNEAARLDEIELEVDNLLSALQIASEDNDGEAMGALVLAITPWWRARGRWREGLAFCRRALECSPRDSGQRADVHRAEIHRAEIHRAAGSLAVRLTRFEIAREHHEAARLIAESL